MDPTTRGSSNPEIMVFVPRPTTRPLFRERNLWYLRHICRLCPAVHAKSKGGCDQNLVLNPILPQRHAVQVVIVHCRGINLDVWRGRGRGIEIPVIETRPVTIPITRSLLFGQPTSTIIVPFRPSMSHPPNVHDGEPSVPRDREPELISMYLFVVWGIRDADGGR